MWKIDTLNNELCVKVVEDCPINFLKIINEENNLQFDISTENTDGTILTEFHATDGEKVCINTEENLFSENDYLLFSNQGVKKRKGCQSYVENPENLNKIYEDDRFMLIDSYPKKQYYEHNGLYVVDQLPHFLDHTKDHTIKLFTATYIGWDKNCMYIGEKSILEEFKQLDIYLKKIEENNNIIITISTFVILYIGIIIFFWKYRNSEIIDHELTIPNEFLTKFYAIYILFIVLNIYILKLTLHNKNLIYLNQNNTSFFDSLFNENCSDHLTNISLKHFGKEFFANLRRYHYMTVFVLLNILSGIFITIFGHLMKRKSDNIVNMQYDVKKFL